MDHQFVYTEKEIALAATCFKVGWGYLSTIPATDEAKIIWEMQEVRGNCVPLKESPKPVKIGMGLEIKYKFKKEHANKTYLIISYIDGNQKPWLDPICNKIIIHVEEENKTLVRLISVSGNQKLSVNEVAKYSAVFSITDKDVSSKTKQQVKWMVKVGESMCERLIINDQSIVGAEISFKIPKEWEGKQIILLPFLNSYTESISVTLHVNLSDGVYLWVERVGTGHTFVSIHNDNIVYVYTYGRFDDVYWTTVGAVGEGVLIKYTGDHAENYCVNGLYRLGAQAFRINDVQGNDVINEFNELWNSSSERPDKKLNEHGRVIDTYFVIANNCTTLSCNVLIRCKSKVFSNEMFTENFTIPSSLFDFLIEHQGVNVENLTNQLKSVFPISMLDRLEKGGMSGESSGSSGTSSGSSANSSSMNELSSGSGSGSSNK